jgi:Dolichyl-phosphate-mannose-protein mannosyltransferase
MTRAAMGTTALKVRPRRLASVIDSGGSWVVPLLPILGLYVLGSLVIPAGVGDEGVFLGFAKNLTHGYFAQTHSTHPAAYLWHGPGLPSLLAPFVALHVPLAIDRLLFGPLLLFAAFLAFHATARYYLPRRGAVLATYALAAYLPFFTVLGHIYVEPLTTLCLTLIALFTVRAYRGGRHDHLWAGLALGVLALSRVEYGYVLLALILLGVIWLLVSHAAVARRLTLGALVGLLLCIPWLAYTYTLSGRPFYWGNSGGLSLYWMTSPDSFGEWRNPDEVLNNPQFSSDRRVFRAVERLKPLDQDSRLEHVAIENIKSNPTHYVRNVVYNVARLFFSAPSTGYVPKGSLLLWGIPNGILLGLLTIAAVAAIAFRRVRDPALIPLAALLILGFAIHVPVAALPRFTVPLVPLAVLTVIAALGPVWTAASRYYASPLRFEDHPEPHPTARPAEPVRAPSV